MSQLNIYKSNYLESLTNQLQKSLDQCRITNDNPFSLDHIVYPNKLIYEAVKWQLVSSGDDGNGCLMGLSSDYVVGVLNQLLEALDLDCRLPRSEELQWGMLAQAISDNPNEAILASTWSRARSIAELIFRLPIQVPSSLLKSSDLYLPDGKSFSTLWRELSLLSREALGEFDNENELTPLEILIEKLSSTEGISLDAKVFSKISSIHLFAPKALGVTLLRLLKSVSAHCPIFVYLITADDKTLTTSPLSTYLQQADCSAFELNNELVEVELDETSKPCGVDIMLSKPCFEVEAHSCTHDSRQVDALYECIEAHLSKVKNDRTEKQVDSPTQIESELVSPGDILVLVSDIERFMPYIQRRFTFSPVATKQKLCAVMYDRSMSDDNPYLTLIDSLCKLPKSRLSLAQIFNLIDLEPVQRKFPISRERKVRLKERLQDLNIKWGLDSQDRGRFSELKSPLHTWRFGIERLLMSSLVDPSYKSDDLHLDIIKPTKPLGKEDELALASFLKFLYVLEEVLEDYPGQYEDQGECFSIWQTWLFKALKELCTVEVSDKEDRIRLSTVKQAVKQIRQWIDTASTITANDVIIDSAAIMLAIKDAMRSFQVTMGTHNNSVIFAPLSLGASYPAKLLMFLGFEKGVFQQASSLLSYDPLHPKQRLKSDEDHPPKWSTEAKFFPGALASERASFTSALLNAESKVCIFWNGEPQFKHQKIQAPCAPVVELLKAFSIEINPKKNKKDLIIHHPISSYDPQLFHEHPLLKRTLSENQVEKLGACAVSKPKELNELVTAVGPHRRRVTSTTKSSDDPALKKDIFSFNDVKKALTSPTEKFLQHANCQLNYSQEEIAHGIPDSLTGLPGYKLKKVIVDDLMALWREARTKEIQEGRVDSLLMEKGSSLRTATFDIYERYYKSWRADGTLAPGALGRALYEATWYEAQRFFWEVTFALKYYQPTPKIDQKIVYQSSSSKQFEIPICVYEPLQSDSSLLCYDYTLSKSDTIKEKLNSFTQFLAAEHELGDTSFDHKFSGYYQSKTNKHKMRVEPKLQSEKLNTKLFTLDRNSFLEHRESFHHLKNLECLAQHVEQVYQGNESALKADINLSHELGGTVKELNQVRMVTTTSANKKDFSGKNFHELNLRSQYLFGREAFYQDNLNPTELDPDFVRLNDVFWTVSGVFSE